jgi:hypothetical protein
MPNPPLRKSVAYGSCVSQRERFAWGEPEG